MTSDIGAYCLKTVQELRTKRITNLQSSKSRCKVEFLAGLRIQTNLPTPLKMVLAFECKVFTPDAFVPCKGLQHPLFYLELVKFVRLFFGAINSGCVFERQTLCFHRPIEYFQDC